MKRYLLDTGIAQDFINARHGVRTRADEYRQRGCRIGISVPVLGELGRHLPYDRLDLDVGMTAGQVPEHSADLAQ